MSGPPNDGVQILPVFFLPYGDSTYRIAGSSIHIMSQYKFSDIARFASVGDCKAKISTSGGLASGLFDG